MKQLFALSLIVSVAATTVNFDCSASDQDEGCHVRDTTLDPNAANVPDFPAHPAISLKNCSVEFFSPQLAAKLSNETKKLAILDGFSSRVHLKPTLKALTVLRGGLTEVQIEPVENFNLEVLDLEGDLRQVPRNVGFLKRLLVLDLCQNGITDVNLSGLNGLPIRKLNLGHNKIRSVGVSGQVELPALQEFFLHGNQLTTLDLTGLKADNLQRFYVSQNQLQQIEGFPANYANLVRVDLFSNRWNCGWLERSLRVLGEGDVQTLNYLPAGVCDERGSVKVQAVECDRNGSDAER